MTHSIGALVGFLLLFEGMFWGVADPRHIISGGDGVYQFLPLYQEQPTDWVDTAFGGYPAYADPQGLRYYPVSRIMSALGFSFNQFTVIAFVLAGWFAFMTLFLSTRSRMGAIVAGLSYSTSSFLFVHLVHVSMLHTAAWLAAGVLAVTRFAETRARLWFAGVSVAVALMILSGSPQLSLYGGGLLGLIGAAECIRRRDAKLAGLLALAFLLGLGLCAVQLFPAAELIAFTPRAKLMLQDFASNAMQLKFLPAIVMPRLFGPWGGPVNESIDFDLQVAVALLAVAFSVFGCIRGPWKAEARVLVCLALGALLLSLRPVAQILFAIPVYNLFRGPSRHLLNFSLLVSLAGGLGVTSLEASAWHLRGRDALAMVAIPGTSLLLLHRLPMPADIPWHDVAGVPVLVLAALALISAGGVRARTSAAIIAAVCLADTWTAAKRLAWERGAPSAQIIAASPEVQAMAKECRTDGCRLLPWSGFWSTALPGNLARLWGVPSIAGYNVLYLSRLGQLLWMDPNGVVSDKARLVDPANQSLKLLGVRYILSGEDEKRLLEGDRFTLAGRAGMEFAFRTKAEQPKVWLTSRAVLVDDQRAIRLIRGEEPLLNGSGFDPATTTLLHEGGDLSGTEAAGNAVVLEAAPGLLRVRFHARAPAVLVANEMHYPGWRAWLDGVEKRIDRANHVQMAVRVDSPGDHEAVFRFAPHRKYAGAAGSALSLLLLIATFAAFGAKKHTAMTAQSVAAPAPNPTSAPHTPDPGTAHKPR